MSVGSVSALACKVCDQTPRQGYSGVAAGKSAPRESGGAKLAQHLRGVMKAKPVQFLATTKPATAAVAKGDDSAPELLARTARVDHHRPPVPFRPGLLGDSRSAARRGGVEEEQASDAKSAGDAGKHVTATSRALGRHDPRR